MEHVETVERKALGETLARILAPSGHVERASAARVSAFADYMTQCRLDWIAWRWRGESGYTGLILALLLPGRTAIVMLPPPGAPGMVPDDQRRLLMAVLDESKRRKLFYTQALIEPQADATRRLLLDTGFRRLTDLIYLQRGVAHPRFEPPAEGAAAWLAYSAETHDDFGRMLLATYEDSRDCPELTGLRTIDAVIASHQAAGAFDPALWEIACVDGAHAGCILLSPLTHGPLMEVVYLGVAPGWRQRGIGKLLLRRSLQHCRAAGARELTAVVDERNAPARQLYARFDFRPMTTRTAFIHTL